MEAQRKPTLGREAWDQRYAEKEQVWGAAPDGVLEDWADGRPAGRALDLACGEGRNALWLAERGWQVTAVDFSSVALARAGRQAEARGVRARLDLVVADLGELALERASYDLVLLAYLQAPMAELGPILRRAAQALAPGGTLLVLGHDLSNLSQGRGGPQSAELLYTPQQVVKELDPELKILRAEVLVRGPQVEGKAALDCLVLAQRGGRP